MTNVLPKTLFGNISGEYCVYFYLLSVIGLVFFAISIAGIVCVALFAKRHEHTIRTIHIL